MSSKNQSSEIKKITIALKKSIGSASKALSMLESENYTECSDVLVQIDSAIGSLNSSRAQIINQFLDLCIDENLKSGNKQKLKNQLFSLYKLAK